MDGIIVLFLAITVLFMVIVAPLWLIMHYLTKAKTAKGISVADREELTHLWKQASKMEKRVEILEEILDKEVTDWRKYDAS